MTDMLTAISGYISGIDAAMQAIPQQLATDAPSGNFGSVLASIQAALGGSIPVTAGSSAQTGIGLTASMLVDGQQPQPTGSTPSGAAVVSQAEQYLGVPYLWGGTTPQGFDCSGLVQCVYGQLGVSLPRTSEEQAQQGTAVASLADAQPGDLVFYAGSDGTPSSPGHVGIYLGNGQMIDAPQTGENVQSQAVGDPVAIRRVLPSATAALTSTGSGMPAALEPLFSAASTQYGLPAQLLPAVASVESGFNNAATSSAEAEGLMQLMPQVAANLGVDPFNPAQSISGAAQMLAGYLKQFGSLPLALAAYNAGPAAVTQYGGVPAYSQSYVQQVMGQMGATL